MKNVSAVVQKESFSDDSGIAESFKIFPNPVDNELYLENPLSVQKAEIFDTHGRIVAVIRGKEPKADVSSLAPGMYMICIHNDQGISYLKFIKN
ncbi:MAG: T9SS type A sorting domain-containing protein [Saprospiraceae bacterium]|nr:T9SS type A sorting domain-containing protein [Saprospiraceae bacterium]